MWTFFWLFDKIKRSGSGSHGQTSERVRRPLAEDAGVSVLVFGSDVWPAWETAALEDTASCCRKASPPHVSVYLCLCIVLCRRYRICGLFISLVQLFDLFKVFFFLLGLNIDYLQLISAIQRPGLNSLDTCWCFWLKATTFWWLGPLGVPLGVSLWVIGVSCNLSRTTHRPVTPEENGLPVTWWGSGINTDERMEIIMSSILR